MANPELFVSRTSDATLVLCLAGPWHLQRDLPSPAAVQREIETVRHLRILTPGGGGWGRRRRLPARHPQRRGRCGEGEERHNWARQGCSR